MSKETEFKLIEITSPKTPGERVPLFSIEGKEYTVPVKTPVNATLKFVNEARNSGNEMFAALALLEAMLGADQFADLLNCDSLEEEDLGAIIDQCVQRALGDRVKDAAKN